jgi:hypothetical protein
MIIVFWWFGASRESAHHAHGHGNDQNVEVRDSENALTSKSSPLRDHVFVRRARY